MRRSRTHSRGFMRVLCQAVMMAVAIGCAGAIGAPYAEAADVPSSVIVFDGSGSMWGKLEGRRGSKLVATRESIDDALSRLPPNGAVGLVSFGRARTGCTEPEVVVAPAAGTQSAISQAMKDFNPKGRGPIVAAVEEAAKALGAARPASIILIHDDPDNCQRDACEAARGLQREHPGMRVHVISIANKPEEKAETACMAEITGGRYFDAQDADQLDDAIKESLRLAMLGAGPAGPASSPRARRQDGEAAESGTPRPRLVAPRPEPPLTGPPGLRLSAVLTKGGPAVTEPVRWQVSRSEGAKATVFETTAPEARVDLAPGSYEVEAQQGVLTVRQTFEVVAERPTRARVFLEAGALALVARAQKGGGQIDQVSYTLARETGTAGQGGASGEVVWIGRDPPGRVNLPPGDYRVSAQRGFAKVERSVKLAAGDVKDVELVLGAGLLSLKAAASQTAEPFKTALFIISEDDPYAPKGRREVARSAAAAPDFVLPAATYVVTVRIGASEVRERVAVGAGESVKRTLLIGMGRLELSADINARAGGALPSEAVSFRIFRSDGGESEVGRFSTSPQLLELPEGSYRVEAAVGAQNVRAVREVKLTSGASKSVKFALETAHVDLKIADPLAARALAGADWDIKGEDGRSVWQTGVLEPRVVLAPGRYTVSLQIGDTALTRQVVVRAGERTAVEIGAP